ncbi:claudin-6-like [Eucyclogobius newberryi]|uniref:claudin-6-like n=1 Tax=Eucyclogobius newberryi TaxID=166745 RepID=UPI003B5C8A4C
MALVLQLVGLVLGLLSWGLTSSCTSSHHWKVKSQMESVSASQWTFEGLWMSCAAASTGSTQCSRFKTVLGLPVHVQVCRGLMILALVLDLVSGLVSALGLKCTRLSGVSDQTKAQLTLSGGVLYILSGLSSLTAVSLYASRVIQDFYSPAYGGVRFELGAALYQGWSGAGLALLGGSLLCCSLRNQRHSAPPHYSVKFTSDSQNIYRAPSESSTKAYV